MSENPGVYIAMKSAVIVASTFSSHTVHVPGARVHTRLSPQIRIKSQTRAGIHTRNNYFLSVKIVSFFYLFTIENFFAP